MKIYYSSDSFNFKDKIAATVGFFDGVHSGHRYLINELKRIAKIENCMSIVFTFANHPRRILHSNFQPSLLTTLEEKLIQLELTGLDACVILDFNEKISQLTAVEFLKTILFEQNNVKTLLVGHDHRFGHNRMEGFAEYYKYGLSIGMAVFQADRYITSDNQQISSSEIRLALLAGNITKANQLLSYKYSLKGKVIEGFKVGQKIGFPTANLKPINFDKLIPAIGVYAVEVVWQNEFHKGMMNIGKRPTFNGTELTLEVNIFDFDKNIYHEIIEIRWIERIRDEIKFNGKEELIKQLEIDKKNVLDLFKKL